MPYIGRSTDNFGVRQRYTFTPSAGATSISGNDVNGIALSFTDGAYVDVYLNGVKLKSGTDYVTTTANTIGSLTATVANDEIEVIVYDVFSLADMVSATNGGTFNNGVTITTADNTNTLKLVSTDADNDVGPVLNFFRNSASPADSDSIGHMEFNGQNDAGEVVRYARIRGRIDDVTDGTEDSKLIFETITAGATQENVRFEPNSIVFNEGSADVDFRVESNGLTHALFVDGGNDAVLVGGSDVSVAVTDEADNLIVGNTSDAITGITLATTSTGYSSINFSDGTSGNDRLAAYLAYDHNNNQWVLGGTGNGNTLLHIHADGRFEQKGGVNSDNGPGLLVFNDGNNTNRKGLGIVCGTDDASGTNIAAFFDSGNSTGQGSITFSGGTVTYGAFTAHHEISLPDDDKSKGYDYGTLLDIDQIYYAKDRDGTNQERGIRYLVKKSSSAYSKKVLGAYCGDLLELADKDLYYTEKDTIPSGKKVGDLMREAGTYKDNLHQAAILGDGHIICNGEKGNISVGDGICTSSTAGIGMKADKLCMIVGIAQEDVTFSSASETKLVVVQYGIRQFTPWV